MTNNYSTRYFRYKNDKKERKYNGNEACWAGCDNYKGFQKKGDTFYINIFNNKDNDNKIKPDLKTIKRTVYLINKLTPCKLMKIDKELHIEYTRFSNNYYAELVLLNMIRMLWYYPYNINLEQFFLDNNKRLKPKECTLKFMLTNISNNVKNLGLQMIREEHYSPYGWGDHSIIYQNIVPKTFDKLVNHKTTSMSNFLIMKDD